MLVRALHGREVGRAVGHVEFQGQEPLAVPGGEIVECAGVAGGGGHGVAALERGDGPFPAEAA